MVQLSFVFSKKMTSIKPKKTVLNIDEEAEGRHFYIESHFTFLNYSSSFGKTLEKK